MEKKNQELLKLVEAALAVAKEIQTENKTQNLDVEYLTAARDIAKLRAAHLENKSKSSAPVAPQQQKQQQQTQQPATREQLVVEFAKLPIADLQKAQTHFEELLKEKPDDADAKLALDVIKEIVTKP